MIEHFFLLELPVFCRFYHGSGYGFPASEPGFFADPDPDSRKSLIQIRTKGPGSETLSKYLSG